MLTTPTVTICVLTYGDYPRLARRVIESIRGHCARTRYRLIVGANAVGNETREYLQALQAEGVIDHLVLHAVNLGKCPMMRELFTRVDTEFIWWFDDDSYILSPNALSEWLGAAEAAPESTAIWGQLAWCDRQEGFTELANALKLVRTATWYRGLPPPAWRPGGKGQFNFEGKGTGDGRWFFILGGCWLIRTRAVRTLDWPDRRLNREGDDVFLGEAIRQHGWRLGDIGTPGVAIDTEPRRGQAGSRLARSSDPVRH